MRSSESLTANSLESFARTAETVAATTRKLEKAALLEGYFRQLDDEDLARAARYFAGQQFASSDARTTNVGGSILGEAMIIATGASPESLGARYARWGDAGDVAFELFVEAKPENQPSLTLAETEGVLAQLSLTRGKKAKTQILIDALSRATALEAKYLVKLLSGDLRIGLREGLVEDAIARAFKQPLAEVSLANMLRGDIGEAAVRARAGALRDVEMRLFHPLKFMLATPASDLADIARTMPDEFFVEDKFDGIRAQAHVQDGRVAIFSRTLDEISVRFPELREPLAALPTDLIIDGEIIAARGAEILPFSNLQKRLGRKTVSEDLLASTPVVFVAWDLLYATGRVLINDPLESRRAKLEELVSTASASDRVKARTLRLSQAKRFSNTDALDDEFDAARARGNEGLMIKDPASFYKPGRRGREWLKLKKALATLDVVVLLRHVAAADAHALQPGRVHAGQEALRGEMPIHELRAEEHRREGREVKCSQDEGLLPVRVETQALQVKRHGRKPRAPDEDIQKHHHRELGAVAAHSASRVRRCLFTEDQNRNVKQEWLACN